MLLLMDNTPRSRGSEGDKDELAAPPGSYRETLVGALTGEVRSDEGR